MMSNDIVEEFLEKLKKEKSEYFIFLAKKPNKKQRAVNSELDMTIAHYQKLSKKNLLVLSYCLSKMIATGKFDPNEDWPNAENGSDEDDDWQPY